MLGVTCIQVVAVGMASIMLSVTCIQVVGMARIKAITQVRPTILRACCLGINCSNLVMSKSKEEIEEWPIEALPSLASQFSRPPNPEPRRITWGDTPSRRSRRKLQRRFPARRRLLAGRPAPGGRSAEGTLESAGSRRTGSPDRRHSDPGAGCQESGSDTSTWRSEARSQSLESSDRYLNSRGKLSVLDYQRFRVEVGSYSGAEQRPVPVLISGEYRLPERSSCRLWLHELGKEPTTIR